MVGRDHQSYQSYTNLSYITYYYYYLHISKLLVLTSVIDYVCEIM